MNRIMVWMIGVLEKFGLTTNNPVENEIRAVAVLFTLVCIIGIGLSFLESWLINLHKKKLEEKAKRIHEKGYEPI